MMTSSAKLTNEQSLHLDFINRFQCGSHHEHGQDWNITHQGWTIKLESFPSEQIQCF